MLQSDTCFLPHPVGTESEEDTSHPGYLMLAPADNDWSEERLPEEWRDACGRLTQTWRERVPQALWVAPNGDYATQPRQNAVKMWWQAAPFALCLTCGEFYTAREREFGKLASLSSEARGSATTVLATALLRHAGQTAAEREKLLSFTDNRQDASLQAGHFNDDPVDDHQYYQLEAACLLWRLGGGSPPPPDPLYARRTSGAGYAHISPPVNAFFQRFYRDSTAALAALEAREHTAQVVTPGERERRERRFRWEDSDTRKVSDLGRRLPYLVCSPTMELGVDIADLDLVHLRNVPPTPANYAQRSGSAGRQGQSGLVFTYCGALNDHDQYFFHRRAEMVAGSVRPPRLDLANEALLRAHVQAAWLAQVRLPLGQSIEQALDTDQDELPLRENGAGQIQLGAAARDELRQRVQRILTAESGLLASTGWFTPAWVDRMLAEAPQHFDRAFDRWRELYRAATRQLIEAQHALLRARRSEEQTQAAARQQEALRQRNLLLQVNTAREGSDFYPYRYLASEGFLPGYNFPALPIRAWVPRGEGEFVARPRFLALREFAPGNILYHEGAKWEVVSFQAPPGGLEERRSHKRLCRTCGAFCDATCDLCPTCHTRFDGDNSLLTTLLDMPNTRSRKQNWPQSASGKPNIVPSCSMRRRKVAPGCYAG
jgi:hypothetical protein